MAPKKDTKDIQKRNTEQASFICLKLRKIAAASFLITAGVEEGNPLRQAIRVSATELLTSAYRVLGSEGPIDIRHRLLLVRNIDLLIGQTETLVFVGELSVDAATVLKGELLAVRETLLSSSDLRGLYGGALSSNFFDVESKVALGAVLAPELVQGQVYQGHKRHVLDKPLRSVIAQARGGKDEVLESISRGLGEERRKTIVEQFLPDKEYSIKDLLGTVPGVSEKTIQRELATLVETGILGKHGERRWSRYYRVKTG